MTLICKATFQRNMKSYSKADRQLQILPRDDFCWRWKMAHHSAGDLYRNTRDDLQATVSTVRQHDVFAKTYSVKTMS